MALFSHCIEADENAVKDSVMAEFGQEDVSVTGRGNVVYVRFNNMNQIRIEFDWDDEESIVTVELQIKRKYTSLAPDRVIGGEYREDYYESWLQVAKEELSRLNKRGN